MKILVALSHGLYLRNFRSLLAELAARGHHIEVAFTAPRAGDQENLAAMGADAAMSSPYPGRSGWWWPAADSLRGLRDYVHVLDPAFDAAPRLVERAARRVPAAARRVLRRGGFWARRRGWLDRRLARMDASIPPDRGLTKWLSERGPDLVVVSPLVDHNYDQLDILKAARALRLPTVHLVASWDNLTSKGRIQQAADRVVVWNAIQQGEAQGLHAIDAGRIAVTGAQLYDHWFEMTPREDRTAFCRRLGGAEAARPIILYVGSSPFICPDETAVFSDWLQRLRRDGGTAGRGATVLVRPHPLHAAQWARLDLATLGPVLVWPPGGAMPIADEDQRGYFDSLVHAAAVVGVNTSAFLEAGIVGRPILSLKRAARPAAATTETLHLPHLLAGGLVRADPDYEGHFRALETALVSAGAPPVRPAPLPAVRDFLTSFIRPHGLSSPATPIVADAVESTRASEADGVRASRLIRLLLAPVAALILRPRYLAALARRDGGTTESPNGRRADSHSSSAPPAERM